VVYAKPHYLMVCVLNPLMSLFVQSAFRISNFSKMITFSFIQKVKGSDTSTAESGSEAEDIASPKAIRNYSHLRLTPVREEVFFCTFGNVTYADLYGHRLEKLEKFLLKFSIF
jgi:hypothetical protein